MKLNAVTVPEAARRKGVTPQSIYYALRVGHLNATRSGRTQLVHLDRAFERYIPNPKRTGKRGRYRRNA